MEARGIFDEGSINTQLIKEKMQAAELLGYAGAGLGAGVHVGLHSMALSPEEKAQQQRLDDIGTFLATGGASALV